MYMYVKFVRQYSYIKKKKDLTEYLIWEELVKTNK